MVKVEFLGPIGRPSMELKAQNLKEVAEALKKDPEIAQWLDQCAVAVNDEMVKTLDTPLKDGDRITLLPPVCGG